MYVGGGVGVRLGVSVASGVTAGPPHAGTKHRAVTSTENATNHLRSLTAFSFLRIYVGPAICANIMSDSPCSQATKWYERSANRAADVLADSCAIRRRHGGSVSRHCQVCLRPMRIHDRLGVVCFSLTSPLTADRSSWAECRTSTLLRRHRSGECRTEPSGNQPPRSLAEPLLSPHSNIVAEEKHREPDLPDLPVALKPQDRLKLEMVVL